MNGTRSFFATTLMAAFVSATLAQPAPAPAQPAPAAAATAAAPSSAGTPMTMAQIIEHVGRKGYTDVREVERKSDKLYEVKARDAKGQWVELYVDSRSGEVLKMELKRKHD